MDTAAAELFRRLKKDKYYEIEALMRNLEPENEFLDYKTTNSSNGKLTDDDFKNLSKAISGFGNSDGGILIWGIGTKDVKTLRNRNHTYLTEIPEKEKIVEQANFFKSNLDRRMISATNPRHTSVENFVNNLTKE